MSLRHGLTRPLQVFSLLLLCHAAPVGWQLAGVEDCVERFGAADDATLDALIKDQPETAKVCVNWLLKAYVSSDAAGRGEDAQKYLRLADRVARPHATVVGNPLLTREVSLQRNWTPERKREKAEADALALKGLEEHSEGRTEAALEAMRQALATYVRLGDEWEASGAFNAMGTILQSKGEFDEALKLLTQSLDIRRRLGDVGATAENLTNIGTIYMQQEMPGKALEAFLPALAIRRQSKDVRWETITLLNVASLYSSMGEKDKAVEYYKQFLPLEGKARFVPPPTLAAFLSGMGSAFVQQGMRSEAHESYRQLEELLKTVEAPPHVAGDLFTRAADAYESAGHTDEALAYYWKAFESYDGDKHLVERGDVLLSVGIIHKNQGRYVTAFETYYSALAYFEKARDDRRMGHVYNNVGIVADKLGMYKSALEFYDTALKLYEKETQVPPHDEADKESLNTATANALMNLGLTYLNIGQYEKALEHFQRVRGRFERPELYERLGSLELNTGAAYMRMGRYNEAQSHYAKARGAFEKSDEAGLADTLANEAEIRLRRGEDAAARALLEQALEIHRRRDNLKEVAGLLVNLAVSHFVRSDFAKALQLYRMASETSKRITDPEGSWRSNTGIAMSLEELGQPLEAVRYYEEAVKHIEALREGIGGGRRGVESRIEFFTGKLVAYERLVSLLLKLSRGGGGAAKDYQRRAFEYADRGKGRGVLDLLAESRALTQIGETSKLVKKLLDAEALVVVYEDALRRESAKPQAQRDEGLAAEYRRHLEQALGEARRAQEVIEKMFPRFAELANPRPVTLEQLQGTLLKERQALVEYAINSRDAAAFIVTPKGLTVVPLSTDAEELAGLVRALRASMTRDAEYDARAAHQLYEKLFRPLEGYIGGATSIYVVPDGALHYVPFEALLSSGDPARRESAFLLNKYDFTYVPSAGVLRTALEDARRRGPVGRPRQPLAIFANPVYSTEAQQGAPTAAVRDGANTLLDNCRSLTFNSLPHTEDEAMSIGRTLGADLGGPGFNVGERASEARLKGLNLSAYRYVHFATHGLVCERDESGAARLQPSLVLSQAAVSLEEQRKGDEGLLQMNEILNLRLDADLVTLSACKTGLGERLEGEGLVGLTRAFMYAGTPSVLVSLWNVADKSTPVFMNRFYSNLRDGMKGGEALREAKRWMLENSSHVEVDDGYRNVVAHDHPYFWAPFVLVGVGE